MKLICGASNQDLLSISDLCAVYAVAGVHCVDVAADIAVVRAARKGLDWAKNNYGNRPWLMISISDGKDVHFRKASFNPKLCPKECPRPCEKICPAEAIEENQGVNANKCYGCGRCLTACPLGLIREKETNLVIGDYKHLISNIKPDAVEIHTSSGRSKNFEAIIAELISAEVPFRRLAVSCGLEGHNLTVNSLARELWQRHSSITRFGLNPLWQLDGRPMSGDLGKGTSRVSIALWEKMKHLLPPGPIQIAGGTNSHTIEHINNNVGPSGIAFGGMARALIQPYLSQAQEKKMNLRDWPEGLELAVKTAKDLINPWATRRVSL
ncbi:LdpA C-terminal domain-containing domain [Prochlorococcus sp. MIT 1300]|uniref:Light dependent period protein LdpA domain-containing protein n=1 Tax=Prochlorococcus sp. MIT 1300 TaxID=3096218 RepID=UPI0039BF12A7